MKAGSNMRFAIRCPLEKHLFTPEYKLIHTVEYVVDYSTHPASGLPQCAFKVRS